MEWYRRQPHPEAGPGRGPGRADGGDIQVRRRPSGVRST